MLLPASILAYRYYADKKLREAHAKGEAKKELG
jgi:hypothetical protein